MDNTLGDYITDCFVALTRLWPDVPVSEVCEVSERILDGYDNQSAINVETFIDELLRGMTAVYGSPRLTYLAVRLVEYSDN
jgi:hypothetical protein